MYFTTGGYSVNLFGTKNITKNVTITSIPIVPTLPLRTTAQPRNTLTI